MLPCVETYLGDFFERQVSNMKTIIIFVLIRGFASSVCHFKNDLISFLALVSDFPD